jgi:hypothetical protein
VRRAHATILSSYFFVENNGTPPSGSTKMSSSADQSRKGRSSSKKRNRKRKCELGSKCPYQHEYQHSLEFLHEEIRMPIASAFTGSGHVLLQKKSTRLSGKKKSTLLANAAAQRALNSNDQRRTDEHLNQVTSLVSDIHDCDSQTCVQSLHHPMVDGRNPLKESGSPTKLQTIINLCDDESDNEYTILHSQDSRKKRQKLGFNIEYDSLSWKVPISKDEESDQLAQAIIASTRDIFTRQDVEYILK